MVPITPVDMVPPPTVCERSNKKLHVSSFGPLAPEGSFCYSGLFLHIAPTHRSVVVHQPYTSRTTESSPRSLGQPGLRLGQSG